MSALQRVGGQSARHTADPASEFAKIIDGLKAKVPPYNPNLTMEENAQGFINAINALSHDTDKKVDAKELADYLGISVEEAQKFIDKYNTPGDADKALDLKELTAALEAEAAPEEGGGGGGGGAGKAEGGQPEGGQPAQGQPPAENAPATALSRFTESLAQLIDPKKDGVSRDDINTFMEKYDTKKDGQIDKKELGDAIKASAAQQGKTMTDAEVQSAVAELEDGMTAANTDGEEGLSKLELSAILVSSGEAGE